MVEGALTESIRGLLRSVEDFRMLEILQGPEKAGDARRTASVIRNAQHLVDSIDVLQQSWHCSTEHHLDIETTEDILEAVWHALHRWLSRKQLPLKLRSSEPCTMTGERVDLELMADPWADCDELAAEDLLEWLADAVHLGPPRRGGLEVSPVPRKVVDDCRHDIAGLTEASTSSSLHSRRSPASPMARSLASSGERDSIDTILLNKSGANEVYENGFRTTFEADRQSIDACSVFPRPQALRTQPLCSSGLHGSWRRLEARVAASSSSTCDIDTMVVNRCSRNEETEARFRKAFKSRFAQLETICPISPTSGDEALASCKNPLTLRPTTSERSCTCLSCLVGDTHHSCDDSRSDVRSPRLVMTRLPRRQEFLYDDEGT